VTFAGKLTEGHCESGAVDTHFDRRTQPSARFSLLDDMIVSRGDKSDWELLHELHYKAEGLPLGPRYWKTTLHGQTIGVIVTGLPKGLLKERHIVMPKLKPKGGDNKLINTQRYVFVNANFRVIGRFVFDTMYRGIGCGYRMMNLAARMEDNTYMEIQSSMSKFNHFGQKAGFKFVTPLNSNKFEVGIRFFRENFSASPQDFEAIVAELEGKPPAEREKLLGACRAFYYRHSHMEKTGVNKDKGTSRVDAMSERDLIRRLQQVTLASPMYGIFKNPDKGRKLPDALPLTAFDRQAPNEPLIL